MTIVGCVFGVVENNILSCIVLVLALWSHRTRTGGSQWKYGIGIGHLETISWDQCRSESVSWSRSRSMAGSSCSIRKRASSTTFQFPLKTRTMSRPSGRKWRRSVNFHFLVNWWDRFLLMSWRLDLFSSDVQYVFDKSKCFDNFVVGSAAGG